jgi:hypothetical protein
MRQRHVTEVEMHLDGRAVLDVRVNRDRVSDAEFANVLKAVTSALEASRPVANLSSVIRLLD